MDGSDPRAARADQLERMLSSAVVALRRAYAEGEEAAVRGLQREQNPYPDYSHTYRFWKAGFERRV